MEFLWWSLQFVQIIDLILIISSPDKFVSVVNHKHLPFFFLFTLKKKNTHTTPPLHFILVNKIANEGILIKVNAFPLPSR